MTRQGKTTLALKLASNYKARGIPVLVLDPMELSRWGADFISDDPEKFADVVFKNTKCAIFVDESAEMIGRYGGVMKKIATRSAQFGHNAHFIVQRAVDMDRTMRDQCTNVFLFRSSRDDGIELSKVYVADAFRECHTLNKGEYLYKTESMLDAKRSKIFENKMLTSQ